MSSIEYINSMVLTASVTSVNFSNIPQNYQDLIIQVNGYGTVNDRVIYFRYNGVSTGTLYSTTRLLGYAGGAISDRYSNVNQHMAAGNWSNVSSSTLIVNILSYSNNNIFKTLLSEWADNSESPGVHIGLFRSTNPISSIEIYVDSGSQVSGSTFTLWGIR